MQFVNTSDSINLIYLISIIEEITKKSKNGYLPLSKATEDEDHYHVVFDDKEGFFSQNYIFYPLIWQKKVLTDLLPDGMKAYVIRDKEARNFHAVIEIDPKISDHGDIIIKKGRWFFA